VDIERDIVTDLCTFAIRYGLKNKLLEQVYTPRALVGMHTYLKLVPREVGVLEAPRVAKDKCSEAQQKYNRDLLRARISLEGCPYKLKPTQVTSCMECDVPRCGRVRRCKLATRYFRRENELHTGTAELPGPASPAG
jgi:hypothetical protein